MWGNYEKDNLYVSSLQVYNKFLEKVSTNNTKNTPKICIKNRSRYLTKIINRSNKMICFRYSSLYERQLF